MKKVIFAAAVAAMVGMVSVPAMAIEKEEVSGTWYLINMEMDGMSINPAAMGMEISMELADDGSASMISEEIEVGTWDVSDEAVVVTIDDDAVEFVVEDDCLVADAEGMIMTFSRELPEVEVFDPGTLVEAPTLEDFEGEWELTNAHVFGMDVQASILEVVYTIKIEDGNGELTFKDSSGEKEGKLIGTLDGNKLCFEPEEKLGEDESFTYFDPTKVELMYFSNDVLVYDMLGDLDLSVLLSEDTESESDSDLSMIFYFERVAE